MKVVLSQVNVGSKFRFMPSGVSSSLSNYPRDGWLTEAAARKWAKANGHEIVKVEKVAGNGEKIHRIEYTYKDRFGKTKKQTSELVGKDVEPLKKRIVEGLERNGDKLVSFGRITSKDSAEDSLVQRIAEKYALDATLITAKGFVTAPGLPTFKLTFDVIKPDGTPTGKKVTKNIGARDKNEAVRIAEDIERKDRKLLLKKVEWAGKTTIAQGPQFLVKPGRPVYNRFDKSSKDSADLMDAWNHLDRDMKRKIISHLKTKWKFSDAIINRFIRDHDGYFSDFIKEKMTWPEIVNFIDKRAKKVDINPDSPSYRHSLFIERGKMSQPGSRFSKLGSGKNPLKIDSADDFASDAMDRIRAKYCLDATKDQSNKKRYEVHYQATAPDGHIYSFIKEAVCTPGQLRGIMKTVEEEQKKKGVTLKKMFTKTVY